MSRYSTNFYDSVTSRAVVASQVALKALLKNYKPKSFIDIGSGEGIWTTSVIQIGNLSRITAVDLPGTTFKLLQKNNKPVELVTINFENEVLGKCEPYDLAICVEVIEHISFQRSLLLLDWVSTNCRTVMFSGATPGQGGTQHINEQNQSYWLSEMMKRGFLPFDNIRPQLHRNKHIPGYYKNNIFFYVNSKFLHEKEIIELIRKTIVQESYSFKDSRSFITKLVAQLTRLLPEDIVSQLAKYKSKIIILAKQPK